MKRYGVIVIALLLSALSFQAVTLIPSPAEARVTKELAEELRPEIEAGLDASDPLLRAHAILAAGLLEDKKLNERLTPFLENTNPELRRAAIVALATQKDKKGLAALDKEIDGAGAGRYVLLTELLPQLPGKLRLDVLKARIQGRKVDPTQQAEALRYAGEFGDADDYALLGEVAKVKTATERLPYSKALLAYPREQALPWAEKLLANKKDDASRQLGMELAVKIGGPKVDGMARAALADPSPQVQRLGLDYLATRRDGSAVDRLIGSIQSAPSDAERIAIIDRVLEMKVKPPLGLATSVLDAGSQDKDTRRAYYRLYGATGAADAVKRLQELERSTNIEERRDAIVGLAWTRTPVATQILSRTINDGDAEVRRLSIEGMALLADPTSVKTLQDALNKARDPEVQRGLLFAISQINSDEAASALMFKVRDRDPAVKQIALDGLARIRAKNTLSVLDVLVGDTDPQIRFKATLLLLELDRDKGIKALSRALQRPPEGYVDLVGALPKALRDEVYLLMLQHEAANIRTDGWDAVLLLDLEGLPLVRRIAATADFNPEVRQKAINLLAIRNDAQDLDLFKNLSQTGSDDQKLQAMRWLLRRANPELAGFFRTLMNGFKGDRPKRAVALYGILKSEA